MFATVSMNTNVIIRLSISYIKLLSHVSKLDKNFQTAKFSIIQNLALF